MREDLRSPQQNSAKRNHDFSPQLETWGKHQYVRTILAIASHYHQQGAHTPEARTITEESYKVASLITNHDRELQSLTQVITAADALIKKLEACIRGKKHANWLLMSRNIEEYILKAFPEYADKLKWWQSSTPVHRLAQKLKSPTNIHYLRDALIQFSTEMNLADREIPPEVAHNQEVITEQIVHALRIEEDLQKPIDELKGIAYQVESAHVTERRQVAAVQIAEKARTTKQAHLRRVEQIVTSYKATKQKSDENISCTYDKSSDCTEIVLTIVGPRIIREKVRVVGEFYVDSIDNKTTFSLQSFTDKTLEKVWADMRKANDILSQIDSPHDVVIPHVDIDSTHWFRALAKKAKDKWHSLKNQIWPPIRNRAHYFAAGLAIITGIALVDKQVEHNHQSQPTAVTHPTLPQTISVPSPTTPLLSNTTTPVATETGPNTYRASTSIGSRYSNGSHAHNTDETLQRLVKEMGFNSVQTKVIATRLDTQLRAARDMQAPSTRTQTNQTVVLEENGNQIRLAVQASNGSVLYQTNWFAREIGFRNFKPHS